MKILVFGNPLVEKDNLTLKLLPKLRQAFPEIEFKETDPVENLEKEVEDRKLIIMDVVKNINKVKLMKLRPEDFGKIQTNKIFSLHDFDLAYNLKLLKKIGKIEKVEIIGVPMGMGEEEVFERVSKLLGRMLLRNENVI